MTIMMMKVKVTMMTIMSRMMMMMPFLRIHTPKRLTKATTNATERR